MADLDDFFAKRDKKKPKGKKFESADDVAKILETKAKERKKQETIKSTYTAPLTEDGLPAQPTNEYRAQGDEDDEWKEVVEEKPDYTGLKIGELVLNDDDSDLDATEQDGREGNDGSTKDGPWSKNKALRNKKEDDSTPTAETAEPVVETEPAIANDDTGNEEAVSAATPEDSDTVATPVPGKYVPPNRKRGPEAEVTVTVTPKPTPSTDGSASKSAGGGAYVPPSRRAGGGATTGPASSSKPKKSSAAPDIDDQKYFPSLGS